MYSIRYTLGYTISLGPKTFQFIKPEIGYEHDCEDLEGGLNIARKFVQEQMKVEIAAIKKAYPLATVVEVIETGE